MMRKILHPLVLALSLMGCCNAYLPEASCGHAIPSTTDLDADQIPLSSFVYHLTPGIVEQQIEALLNHVQAGVMVYFRIAEEPMDYAAPSIDSQGASFGLVEANDPVLSSNDYDVFSGWVPLSRWMGNIPDLAKDGVVAYANADIGVLSNSTGLLWEPPAEFANTSCVVLDFHKDSANSVCITPFWTCEGRTADNLRAMTNDYEEEQDPDSDLGVVAYEEVANLLENGPGYLFVRYGQEWSTPTRQNNKDWGSLSHAVQYWQDNMKAQLVRVDCTPLPMTMSAVERSSFRTSKATQSGELFDPCQGINTTEPQFVLYNKDDGSNITFVASLQTFSYDLSKRMYEFLRQNTAWTPEICSELEDKGLPLWTPCQSKPSDIQEPSFYVDSNQTSTRIFQLHNRGEMVFLLRTYDFLYVHFTDHKNSGSVQHMLPLFVRLAEEHQGLTDRGIFAMAVAETLPQAAVQDLLNLTFPGGDSFPYYAIDRCNINYGMMFWEGCMNGFFYGRIPNTTLEFQCDPENGYKGGELGCSRLWSNQEVASIEESTRWHIANARMEHEPTSDGGIIATADLSEMLKANDTVFVRYSSQHQLSRGDRTNEAWELLAQKANQQQSQVVDHSPWKDLKVVRAYCAWKDPFCYEELGISSYPTFMLHYEGSNNVFRNTIRREDDDTYSEEFAQAMYEFLVSTMSANETP